MGKKNWKREKPVASKKAPITSKFKTAATAQMCVSLAACLYDPLKNPPEGCSPDAVSRDYIESELHYLEMLPLSKVAKARIGTAKYLLEYAPPLTQ